ncbi:hypothetical protein VOLCADRAFT_95072 [Volvox carteri f. nagariensis]|uniref:Uncharacterized protein n=1 Tax=Volvox carteri f. nagariensis TaxID=3068 RepID=D8U6I6_VOLCA|nr:uncharacterized protein VOLCADRAFT_95072 [Volvox carteri f. nagariensis]EFJ44721.1 hypothetical protein VOLCADRAFT_95072 [Volvox carteri f. nagariensis]|eukprot:XP_002954297.1 hypothetical protein VOLCADRAFT_95072 [Volvox carteri f. nagariensis]
MPVLQCSSQQNTIAESKRAAAKACVDRFICSGTLLGLGPGEMDVVGVPVCDAAAHEAAFHGVPLVADGRATEAAVVVADADQFDMKANAALVGCAAEPQQPDVPRLLAALTTRGSASGSSSDTGPVLVLLVESSRADSWEEHAEQLDDIFLGDAELWRRSFAGQPENPRGGDHPYVSPQGYTIVDVRFYEGLKLYGENEPYDKIADEVQQVAGVAGHGLLIRRAAAAVIARPGDEGPQVVEF